MSIINELLTVKLKSIPRLSFRDFAQKRGRRSWINRNLFIPAPPALYIQDIIPFKAGIIRLYTLPVSAGTGNFLDSDDYIEVDRDNTIPKKADFGVKISGDSMEPRFTNGQTVWIEQTSSLEDGEIGIFLLDGNAYCKKLQNNKKGIFLVSLNKKYNPIPIKEYDSLKIFGRVVL